ncbi:MAG: hypothetical protein GF364_17545, partial [Candidatus Lokiarchaeota archaeon]|nr:hypothetical protein [Candidatus Lokiarchaeota archaeon]
DTHYSYQSASWLEQNSLWENDSLVLAPDFIAISGDVVEHPYEEPQGMELAYNHLGSLGTPLVFTCGNHDQKMLSVWRHYFGPIYSTARFDDVSIISFDSSLPIGSGIMNWLSTQSRKSVQYGPTFLMCHYPPQHEYFTFGGLGVLNIMEEQQVTGILSGHIHMDYLADVQSIKEHVMSGDDDLKLKNIANQFDDTGAYLNPITKPLVIITRTAAKNGYTAYEPASPHYAGYRRLSVTNNVVSNYTYDYDDDGTRDPQVCVPNGQFETSVVSDSGNWIWSCNSQFNEDLNMIRAIVKIPNPSVGMKWDLVSSNKTNGAYIRACVSDDSTTLIDARCSIDENSNVCLEFTEVLEEA